VPEKVAASYFFSGICNVPIVIAAVSGGGFEPALVEMNQEHRVIGASEHRVI